MLLTTNFDSNLVRSAKQWESHGRRCCSSVEDISTETINPASRKCVSCSSLEPHRNSKIGSRLMLPHWLHLCMQDNCYAPMFTSSNHFVTDGNKRCCCCLLPMVNVMVTVLGRCSKGYFQQPVSAALIDVCCVDMAAGRFKRPWVSGQTGTYQCLPVCVCARVMPAVLGERLIEVSPLPETGRMIAYGSCSQLQPIHLLTSSIYALPDMH